MRTDRPDHQDPWDDYTSVEHVLLAMLKHDRDVAGVLKRFNLDEARFMAALKDVRGNQRVTTADPEGTFQALEKYCKDSPSSRARASSTRSSAATRRSAA
jgi:ATP-dependent Clp protease ATP-binding subunit ClpA